MLLINKVKINELNTYREEYLDCLKHNISNSIITKIIIWVDDPDHNIPKLSNKVDVFFKKDQSIFNAIEVSKKLTPEEIIIFSTTLCKFNHDLFKIKSEVGGQTVLTDGGNYFIFARNCQLSDVGQINGIFPLTRKKINLHTENQSVLKISHKSSGEVKAEIKPIIKAKSEQKVNFTPFRKKVLEKVGEFNSQKIIKRKGVIPQVEVKRRSKKLDVIIVSVNYNDLLIVSLSHNVKIFENITVVTSPDDLLCQKICQKFGVNCVVTNVMYEGGAPFNKGKAINEGIKSLDNPDFILLIDADIVLESKIDIDSLNEDVLYTSSRLICKSYQIYKTWKDRNLDIEKVGRLENNKGIGFFQLFNISNSNVDRENPYPENSQNASWSDLIFRDKFPRKSDWGGKTIHLGDPYINWDGRVTRRFLTDEEFLEILNRNYYDYKENDWGVYDFKINNSKYGCLNLKNQKSISYHRSGWRYALESMYIINSEIGIRTECFLESIFCWSGKKSKSIKENWIGFLHNPIDTEKSYLSKTNSIDIFDSKNFLESLKMCSGIFVFSKFEQKKLKEKLNKLGFKIPVNSILHPVERCEIKWSYEKFIKDRTILHVGWWLRDLTPFYGLKTEYKKIRIKLNDKIEDFLRRNFTTQSLDVFEISNLDAIEYDSMLSSSIVFLNLIDAVANNTILECIERQTPLLVNKIPSVVEYLGEEYPLFYENLEDLNFLLQSEKILEAHEYLKKLKCEYSLGRQVESSEIYSKISNFRTLFLPGDFDDSLGGVYNPGFCKFEGKDFFLPRIEKFTEYERVQNNLWKTTTAVPKMVEVDENLKIKKVIDLKLKNYSGGRIEDFRLFEHKGTLYSNHILVENNSIFPVLSSINLKSREMDIIGRIEIDKKLNKVEKNWTFISIRNDLFLIYSLSPLLVYKVDINNMKGSLIKNSNDILNWSKSGYISASTNPIIMNDGSLLMGFHSRDEKKIYHQGFLLMNDRFDILRITKEPYLSGGDFDGINKNVIYTMSIKETESHIECFAGDGDYKSISYKIKKEDLWRK
jgi:predicted GH43/DUF377 family glycosyl hydrolase/GTP:adenosylcobinamide-phosphate guanylyltransferase